MRVGPLELPASARLTLQVTHKTLQPLEFIDVAHVPAPASGLIFLHSMTVASGAGLFKDSEKLTQQNCYASRR